MTTHEPASPSFGDMIGEVLDLLAGGTAALLPGFLLAVPCVALLVVPLLLVGLLLAAIGAVVALLAAPPYLLVRSVRRRRAG
jgi:hypothetical protein